MSAMSGSGFSNKVLVATLWQRTSDKGTEYLSGFLGKARVIGFRGQPTADGIPTWDIYMQPREGAGGAQGCILGAPGQLVPAPVAAAETRASCSSAPAKARSGPALRRRG